MIAAGVTVPVLDKHGAPQRDADGKPMVEPSRSTPAYMPSVTSSQTG
jgi:hypothetical protein